MVDEESRGCSNALAKCRFVQSPFVDIEDKAYRKLLHKYGVDLTYPKVVLLSFSEEYCREKFGLGVHADTAIYEVEMESADLIAKSAQILKENGAFALDILTSKEDWNEILEVISDVSTRVSIPVAYKLNINFDDIDETIQKIDHLSTAGCKVLLLHGRQTSGPSPGLYRKHWDTVRKIRNSTSLECMLVEIQCSSLREVEQCLEYTGVQGVAIADPLLWNPAFFYKKRISTIEMIGDHIGLCQDCCTPLSIAKMHIEKFSGYFLKRFPDAKINIDAATSYQDIAKALDTLEQDMAQLSKKQVKGFEKLQQKKEKHRISKLKRKGLQIESTVNNSVIHCKKLGHTPKKDVKQEQRERALAALKTGQRVAIDLSLEQHMSDKEITKVAGQVRRLYGSNLQATQPFHLYLTGLNKNGRIYKECQRQNSGFDNYLVDMHEKPVPELFDLQSVIYLSPDSTNVLDQLDSSKVYVIGGLVDHQVLKGVSLNNADQSHINTARLPLDKYMEKSTTGGNHSYSRVLAVNQVFDILLNFHKTHDWSQALLTGVPKRKGFQLRDSPVSQDKL